jgi:hypothetical protein
MAIDYLCPICKGQLRIVNSIVISVKTKTNKKGLLFLNQEIGNYGKITHPSFTLVEGDELTVFCPICHATLNREENPHLVKLNMIDEKGVEVDVFISGIVGENCTYVVKNKAVIETGPDAKLYEKYFDIPEQDRKYL